MCSPWVNKLVRNVIEFFFRISHVMCDVEKQNSKNIYNKYVLKNEFVVVRLPICLHIVKNRQTPVSIATFN